MENVLSLKEVSYKYEGEKKSVLKNISADFETGKIYTIVGKSGAGKSTLLSLISGLDVAGAGIISCKGEDIRNVNRDKYRAQNVGVVFQGYNMLTNLSALQNIILSMNISSSPEKDKKTYAYTLLGKMGIDRDTADRKVIKLSGGEQQRVGIARALSHNPPILIADEPTGNLDSETEGEILKIFETLAREENRCVIIVTHSRRVTSIADIVYGIKDGKLTQIKGYNERRKTK
ncbi:MAG: ABC transporter ATP-binding protein [Oscillospiraceae bacterium]|nr:ABC transporter ATP-binding protein [Oscillospiraceae bacterium]